MLTGTKAFPGEGLSETLATVIKSEPPWDQLPAEVPARVVQVVHACLQKDRNQRIRDVGDVQLALQGAFEATARSAASAAPETRSAVLVGLAALVVGGLLSALGFRVLGPPYVQAPPVYRLALPVRDAPLARTAVGGSRALAVFSDGTTIIYVGRNAGGEDQLYHRRLDQERSEPLNATVGARNPFISPDGESVGFVTREPQALRTVRMDGGSAQTVAEPSTGIAGATWADDGTIIFCTSSGSQVAVAIDDQDGGRLWLWHQERLSPIAREATCVGGSGAVWTEPNGERLVFKARSAAGGNLFWVAADNSGPPVQFTESSTVDANPAGVATGGSSSTNRTAH